MTLCRVNPQTDTVSEAGRFENLPATKLTILLLHNLSTIDYNTKQPHVHTFDKIICIYYNIRNSKKDITFFILWKKLIRLSTIDILNEDKS